jgi:Peptidase family M23
MLPALASIIVMHLLVPALFMGWLGWARSTSRLDFGLRLLVVALYAAHLFLAGRWDWLSYYLRFVIPLLLLAAAVVGWWKARRAPALPAPQFKQWRAPATNALIAAVFAFVVAGYASQGYAFDGRSVALSFPLQNGVYYVAQGGNHRVLNHHHSHPAQRYALDVVKLNAAGLRADGLYPEALSRYRIFGETLVAPCSGTVSAAENSLPDLVPPERNPRQPAGNHVVIVCNGAAVLLAHLQQGSVRVKTGDNVRAGQPIARVGNSGNTTEPHLHIHAVRAGSAGSLLAGEGLPMLFDGRFLVRNAVVHAD